MKLSMQSHATVFMMVAFALPLGAALSGCGSGAGDPESKMTSFTSSE